MSNKDQESKCEKQTCLYKPRPENIVCAVMFAIVISILGSAMLSLAQGLDKNVAMQEVYESSIRNDCHAQVQLHFVQKIVRYGDKGSNCPALLRALALFLFCAGYFGDEWRKSIQDNANKFGEIYYNRELQDFSLEFLGWLFFILQASLVHNFVLYASLGVGAICCVSLNLEKRKTRGTDDSEISCVDDWLCENAIWMTWLILSSVTPLSTAIRAGGLFLVSLLIFITKVIEWTAGRHYTRGTLVAMSIFFPLPLLIVGFFVE